MNRAEKRRKRKLSKMATRTTNPVQSANPSLGRRIQTIQQTLDIAVQHHTAGRLPQAEKLYRQILHTDPNQPVALHLLGVIAHQEGNIDGAVDFITKALAIAPGYAEAHNNLGNVLRDLGKMDEAVDSYYKALEITPDYAKAHNNLGNALRDLGNLDEAVASYYRALASAPDLAEAHNNLGNALRELGDLNEAVASYHKALAVKPDYTEALRNLGNALRDLGKLDEAVASYHKALAVKPDYTEALSNLGTALRDLGKLDEAVASYRKALAVKPDFVQAHCNLAYALNSCGRQSEALRHFKSHLDIERGDNPIDPQHKSFRFITKAKMNHDIEQFKYLASLEPKAGRFQELANIYEAVDKEIDWPNDDGMGILLRDDHRQRLRDTYNRPIHLLEAPVVTGSALRSNLDVEKITADYFAHSHGMTHIDGVLSSEALASLRRFLLGSTIWFDFTYSGGYLGAKLKDGLACPLLLQIADDLRQAFPDIFKSHQLNELWAYKYDSHLTGIEVHADFAAINVNFWITPNMANLNPETGGLVVYDVEAPLDWHFKLYNQNLKRIRKHLADHGSSRTVVPYGENRMVLFNSNLFHETDSIDFKPGYENRRINITMLFGRRRK